MPPLRFPLLVLRPTHFKNILKKRMLVLWIISICFFMTSFIRLSENSIDAWYKKIPVKIIEQSLYNDIKYTAIY